jgi:hypothetical protein
VMCVRVCVCLRSACTTPDADARHTTPHPRAQVRAAFEALREPHWVVQDAAQPVEQIHKQVCRSACAARACLALAAALQR